MKKDRKLALRRETFRELSGTDLRNAAGGSIATSTDPSNHGCCCATDGTITCQTHTCV